MFCGVSVLSGDFVGRVSHGKLFLGTRQRQVDDHRAAISFKLELTNFPTDHKAHMITWHEHFLA